MSLPVPERRVRVIVDTDAKNEADDQYAIVHALLTPLFDLRGIIPAHFGTRRTTNSLQESRDEVDLILRLMGLQGTVAVADGAPNALPDERTPVGSDGARRIIDEALKDEGTLYVAFLGPLTDMADAILLEPAIVQRDVVVIWIGGPPYGETAPAYWPEFNLSNDVHAANVVFGSGMQVWQVPMPVYTQMSVGYAELAEKVAPCGEIGRYLVEQVIEHNTRRHPVPLESRSLGDTPAIGLMMSPTSGQFRLRPPVRFTAEGGHVPATSARSPAAAGRPVRVYESVDARFFLEDFFAKLRRFAHR